MNIYQKMAKATEKLGVVAKNLTVSTGKSSYKAVGERDILDAVKPVEVEFGIYSYPYDREIVESERLESEGYDGKVRTTFYIKMKTIYRFVNADKPDEFIDTVSFSTGLDSGDKPDGKAMTYADKYALMKAYKISTGDDPDATGSEEQKYTKVSTGKGAPRGVPIAESPVTETNVEALRMSLDDKNVPEETILQTYKVKALEELTLGQWKNAMNRLEATEIKEA